MDNITHSLVGLATAQYADAKFNKKNTKKVTVFFVFIALLAANFPDLDILIGLVEKGRLAYLLHHRGHTHTFFYLIPQMLVVFALSLFLFRIKDKKTQINGAVLIAVNMILHIALDFQNSYGIHPFTPFDNHWYYNDTLFIIEPLIWFSFLPLFFASILNQKKWALGSNSARLRYIFTSGFVSLFFLGVLAIAFKSSYLSFSSFFICVCLFIVLNLAYYFSSQLARVYVSFILLVIIISTFSFYKQKASEQIISYHQKTSKDSILDVILSPMPANPWCWKFLLITASPAQKTYTTRSGVFKSSLKTTCPRKAYSDTQKALLHQRQKAKVFIATTYASSIEPLVKNLPNKSECKRDEWLQFARAPFAVSSNKFIDLRFQRDGDSFASLKLNDSKVHCLKYKVPWIPPRKDLLKMN